jgi:hypothetical protein
MNDADRQKPPPGELYVDHVSHFVADLEAAARVCEKLGLRVTPLSIQNTPEGPVGTANRCVMLEQGYIELLSPTHNTPPAQRMCALMERHDGVHLLCFGTPDAEGEHQRLAAHGFEPQPLVDLSRAVEGGTARFKVVRLAPEKMPEGRIQYVEHLTPEQLWRAADINALRLEQVFVVADDPAEAAARWAEFAGMLPTPEDDGVRIDTDRGSIFLGARKTLKGILGDAPPAPAIAGYALGCSHPEAFVARCLNAGLTVEKRDGRYSAKLPAALGGAWVIG